MFNDTNWTIVAVPRNISGDFYKKLAQFG